MRHPPNGFGRIAYLLLATSGVVAAPLATAYSQSASHLWQAEGNADAFPRPKAVKVRPVDSSGQPIQPAPAIIYAINEKGEVLEILYTGQAYWQTINLGIDKIIRATIQLDNLNCSITANFALADPVTYSKKFATIDLTEGCVRAFGRMTMNFGAARSDQQLRYNNHFVLAPDNEDTSKYAEDLQSLKNSESVNFNVMTETLSLIQLKIYKGVVGGAIFAKL